MIVAAAAAVVVIAAGALLWWAWSHPLVEIHNALLDAAEVTIAGQPARRIDPRGTLRFRTSRVPMSTNWQTELEGPSSSSRGLGQRLSRSQIFTADGGPLGVTTFTLGARAADGAYFAPLITNNSNQALRIVVNWQLSTASGGIADQECRCVVPPGATRQFIGYYRLYANSNVRAIAPSGRAAMFENVGPAVDATSGQLLLKFNASDLTTP